MRPADGCLTSGAVVVLRRGWDFAKHTAGELIRVADIPNATGTRRQNGPSKPAFFNFFSSFVSLCLSLLLSPSIMLRRTLCTISGRGGKKKKKKSGSGRPIFFPQFTEAEGGGVIVS